MMSFPKVYFHYSVYLKQFLCMILFSEQNTAVAAHAYTINRHSFVHFLYTAITGVLGSKKVPSCNPVR